MDAKPDFSILQGGGPAERATDIAAEGGVATRQQLAPVQGRAQTAKGAQAHVRVHDSLGVLVARLSRLREPRIRACACCDSGLGTRSEPPSQAPGHTPHGSLPRSVMAWALGGVAARTTPRAGSARPRHPV